MNSEHPAYPNPTITEAVCDIRFRLSSEKEWRPSFPGELFKHIQNEYPEMEPVLEMGLQFEFGPLGAGTKFVPQRQKVRFKHDTRPLILQLAEDSLSISTLSPYQGWETMRHDVLAAWQRVEEVLQPEEINRIGLRYINRINKETAQERPSAWFVANDYISAGFLRSEPGFLLREEIHLDAENILIITLGDNLPDAGAEHGAIIIDIDRIFERAVSPGQEVLMQEMERLHTDVWRVFSSAQGEKLATLLNRRPQ
ncbi:MAG: TIGR04255 family protein [Ktedonobacteraceae bacterium]|nr:TIGR04255 family protein [Ktedonobacteraceae bacterium]